MGGVVKNTQKFDHVVYGWTLMANLLLSLPWLIRYVGDCIGVIKVFSIEWLIDWQHKITFRLQILLWQGVISNQYMKLLSLRFYKVPFMGKARG